MAAEQTKLDTGSGDANRRSRSPRATAASTSTCAKATSITTCSTRSLSI